MKIIDSNFKRYIIFKVKLFLHTEIKVEHGSIVRKSNKIVQESKCKEWEPL